MLRVLTIGAVLVASLATAPSARAQAPAAPAAAAPTAPNDYSKDANWLCRPGVQGACDIDLSTTGGGG